MTAASNPDAKLPISTPPRKKRNRLRPSRAFLQPAVEAMAHVRAERGHCVFAFTAPNRRAGTSYVVQLLAEELAAQFDATVVVLPTAALKSCEPKRLPQAFTEKSPNLWTAVPDETLQHMPDFALKNLWISPGAKSFDFILVDCPALEASPLGLRWATEVDGVMLVVQAGVTRVDQIESAQRLLQPSSHQLKGMVLNRRTYPIPNLLYKLL